MSSISAVSPQPPVSRPPPRPPEAPASAPDQAAKAPSDDRAQEAVAKQAAAKAQDLATTAVRAQTIKAAGPGKVLDIQV